MNDYRNIAEVSGIGMTDLTRDSGTDTLHLALAASHAALEDAGLTPADIGAVLTYHLGDTHPVNDVAYRLGVDADTWTNEISGGGSQSASVPGDAAMLVATGVADHVLVYRALNGRSGKRMNQAALNVAGGERQFTFPYGMAGPVNLFALAASRWIHDGEMSADDLAAVVTTSRRLSADNPRALMRAPMTHDEYTSSPLIATPLRRVDCCQETDGAAAIVISRADSTPSSRRNPRIRTAIRASGPGVSAMDKAADIGALFSQYLAEPLWHRSGLRPADVGLAMIYDAYSPIVLKQLQDLGFAPRGEAGRLFDPSASDGPAVNPHGGLLSEGYVHGLNNVLEAVRQLRGESPTHQVDDTEFAVCTGFGGSFGSALILQNH